MRVPDNTGSVQDPYSLGAVILDKLIGDLKAKFGPKTREQLVDASDRDHDDTDPSYGGDGTAATGTIDADSTASGRTDSLMDRLKGKLQAGQSSGKNSPAPKKAGSRVIQVIIVLGLALFLAEPYIFPPDEAPAPSVALKPRKRKAKPAVPTEATPETKAEPAAAAAPAESTPATGSDLTTDTPPDSPVEVTSTEGPAEPATPSDLSAEANPDIGPVSEAPTTTAFPSDVPAPAVSSDASSSPDSVDGSLPTEEGNLTDKILEDLEKQAKASQPAETPQEYVPPPNYDYHGRGLVYNCVGKHWACLDGPSYRKCEENELSAKRFGKAVECHPFNVYENQRGCEAIQGRMVSSGAKTGFCQR